MFNDRAEAGILLAKKLEQYRNDPKAVVVAIPRGGLPVGHAISVYLNLPMDIILSKKIGHPLHKEFAIGAVTLDDVTLSTDISGIPKYYIKKEVQRIRTKLRQRKELYYGRRNPISLKGKIAILVDDGVATGHTLLSSLELINKQQPLKIIVALPVGPLSTLKKIKELPSVSELNYLLGPDNFQAVGQFYKEFGQVDDQEVIRLFADSK